MTDEFDAYTPPFTPSGRSALIQPPPWHFTGDVLAIEYRTDPRALASFVPAPLVPCPDGRAAAFFCDWQSCGDDHRELDDPVRSQFKEFYVVVACELDGRPVSRCAFMWVDRTFSVVRGWLQGLPKKHGDIRMTRPVRVGRAGPRLAPGGRLAGTLAASDRRLAEATVELTAQGAPRPELFARPMINSRVIPEWGPDAPAVHQLVQSDVRGVEWTDVYEGTATLAFQASPVDELQLLQPVDVERGCWFSYAESLFGGKPVARAET